MGSLMMPPSWSLAGRQVPAAEILGEPRRVRTGDLDLALDADVAQDGLVDQVPEVLLAVAEVTCNIHVVVNRKPGRAPTQRGIRKGRLPDLRAETEPVDHCVFAGCHILLFLMQKFRRPDWPSCRLQTVLTRGKGVESFVSITVTVYPSPN
jgi:hypothetical protein